MDAIMSGESLVKATDIVLSVEFDDSFNEALTVNWRNCD
jgi:hypothetical protein